jgi:acyl-CoA hydrolase
MTHFTASVEACVDAAIDAVGPELRLGAPLGLGKPVQLLNAFYDRAAADPTLTLHIYTALSLEVPQPGSEIEAELAGPIVERLFGDYEGLRYMAALRGDGLPPNITVSELYFKAGSLKDVASAQQHYISSNYTHIARDLCAAGVNVLTQLVASRGEGGEQRLSLSCNSDTATDLLACLDRERPGSFIAIAQTHPDLPFMEHDAELSPERFDIVLTNPELDRRLFAVPNAAVPCTDYATALHASRLVVDGGTLQVGIGALGDAVAQALILRQQHNETYQRMLDDLGAAAPPRAPLPEPFEKGLYVSTEMFVNGMLRLRDAGVLKRRVYDDLVLQEGLNDGLIGEAVDGELYSYLRQRGWLPRHLDPPSLARGRHWGVLPATLVLAGDGLRLGDAVLVNDLDDPVVRDRLIAARDGSRLRHGRVLHGGFFLGPRDFYERLRGLDEQGREEIVMTSVLRTNQLLLDYPLYVAQRRHARFINTGMMVSLSGAVTSDALEDGTVISGVGGQYNFVAMAHDLPGARSVLCIRATRGQGRELWSNIVPHYGHTTIPRHLRDMVVTEYGCADLRGQEDAEVIRRLIAIADSRFQEELAEAARTSGKLPASYRVPRDQQRNTPERLQAALAPHASAGFLPEYPFGTELTEQEIALASSLRHIKALSSDPAQFVSHLFRALLHHGQAEQARPYLERIHLEHPGTSREFLIQQLLLLELEERGLLKAG